MIADTIVVVLLCIMPAQEPKQNKENRFKEIFEQADREFDKKYRLDIEALKSASREAAIQAFEKTKNELFMKEEK